MYFLNNQKTNNTGGISMEQCKRNDLVLMDNFLGKLYSIMKDIDLETNKTLNHSNRLNIINFENDELINHMNEKPTQDIMTHLQMHIQDLESILYRLTLSNSNFKLVLGE